MKINLINLYKLVECDGCLLLLGYHDRINLKHVELVAGQIADLNEYVPVYLHERAAGRTIKQAHATALRGANIIGKNSLEDVSDVQLDIVQ